MFEGILCQTLCYLRQRVKVATKLVLCVHLQCVIKLVAILTKCCSCGTLSSVAAPSSAHASYVPLILHRPLVVHARDVTSERACSPHNVPW